MKNWYLFGFILVVLGSCVEKPAQEKVETAANFKLVDTDSTYRQLTDFKSKIIMIHFWADWCPHCRQEFPELQKAYDELKSKGFLIVGINSGQSFDHVIGIQQEFNLTFPMLVDEEAMVAKEYKVAGLPSSFFIDEKGKILATEVGWVKLDKIKEMFNKLSNSG
jgi:cytochrome c biogenesis protein CcmG, thiol:disulfide interchange protein DsbE